MPPTHLLYVPYDSGHRAERLGAGPLRLREAGIAGCLRGAGHDVRETLVEAPEGFRAEVATAFALHGRVAGAMRETAANGALPIVVSGNCNAAAVGSVAGLANQDDLGILWLDAHGDFNTPETSTTGFLDGMALGIATGGCWRSMACAVRGFRPVAESRAVLLGGRDLDEAEASMLRRSAISHVREAEVRARGVAAALGPALDALVAEGARRLYLHVDLVVHDEAELRANQFACAGGLTRAEVLEAIAFAASRIPLAAAGITAYDPSLDDEGGVAEGAIAVGLALAGGQRLATSG